MGTRLGPLASRVPKGMLPVAGRPFLETVIEQLVRSGIVHAILCVGHLADVVVRHFGDGARWGARIEYSREAKPLGTAGALRAAAAGRDAPYLVLNGDSYAPVDLRGLLAAHRASVRERPGMVGTLVLSRMAETDQYGGVAVDGDGVIVSFDEKPLAAGSGALVSAGIYVLEREVVDAVPEGTASSLERDVFPRLARRLGSFTIERPFLDIGTPERYARAQTELAALVR